MIAKFPMKAVLMFLGFGLTIYSCVNPEKDTTVSYQAPFRNFTTNQIDSLIQKASLAEKAGQLIFLSANQLNYFKNNSIRGIYFPGGVIGSVTQIRREKSLLQKLDSSVLGPTLKLNDIDVGALESGFLSDLSLNAVLSDSIAHEFAKHKLLQLQLSGFSMNQHRVSLQPEEEQFVGSNPYLYKWNQDRLCTDIQAQVKRRMLPAITGTHLKSGLPLDSVSLNFARNITKCGLSAIIFDSTNLVQNRLPDSLSFYLKKEIGFDGLIMFKGDFSSADDEFISLLFDAGIDVFIPEKEPIIFFEKFNSLVRKKTLDRKEVQLRCEKVLLAKSWSGLLTNENPIAVNQKPATLKLADEEYELKKNLIWENSITLVSDSLDLMPIPNHFLKTIYLLSIGNQKPQKLVDRCWDYTNPMTQHIQTNSQASIVSINSKRMRRYKPVIIVLNDFRVDTSSNFTFINDVNKLSSTTNLIIINIKNPSNLKYFDPRITLLQTYDANNVLEDLLAQSVFGGVAPHGILPVSVSEKYVAGMGVTNKQTTRFKYIAPEEISIDAQSLKEIDSLIMDGIFSGSFPGCQVLLAKDGKIFYEKAYGHHTYSKTKRVTTDHLYDLASLTKVTATTASAMRLYDQGAFKMNDSLGRFLDLPWETTIENIRIGDLFSHSSGLQANMPVIEYLSYVDSNTMRYDKYYCWDDQQYFTLKVAENYYLGDEYRDSVLYKMRKLKVDTAGRYAYSDVNFNLIQQVIERSSEKTLDEYARTYLYAPLGLNRMTYMPLETFSPDEIVPTEEDKYWRMQLVHGFVHDESAAILGGVAGNAGLFSNAHDLAVVFQMFLNGGSYGGQRFIRKGTIDYFTAAIHGNHRGLGFDKQCAKGTPACSVNASSGTFGHTGFTGTCVWADPEENILFVFLSNRVHPSRSRTGIYGRHIRENIHDVVYRALNSSKQNIVAPLPQQVTLQK